MSSAIASQLRGLRLAFAAQSISEAAYQERLELLRLQHGVDRVDSLLSTIRLPDDAALRSQEGARERGALAIAGYLERVRASCEDLPLLRVSGLRKDDAALDISLRQIYIEAATTGVTARETVADMVSRKSFDAAAFLERHRSPQSTPRQLRSELRVRTHLRGKAGSARASELSLCLEGVEEAQLRYQIASPDDAVATFYGPLLAAEAIAAQRRLVILGKPGSGKSTVLRYLASALADSLLRSGESPSADAPALAAPLIPIYVPLLSYARQLAGDRSGGAEHFWAFLRRHTEELSGDPALWGVLSAEIFAGNALLMLDGLDEVAGRELRRLALDAIAGASQEQPDCRMVVTCRIHAYEGPQNAEWRLSGWPVETLADWCSGQVNGFVDAWYRAAAAGLGLTEERRAQRAAQLLAVLGRRHDLSSLARSPLLLTIMVLVHLNDGRLPEDQASLYGRFVDILLDQWEIAGRGAGQRGRLMDYIGIEHGDAKMLRPLLEDIAADMHGAGQGARAGHMARARLAQLVRETLADLGHPQPDLGAQRFADFTDTHAGPIQANAAGDAYTFPHQTLQEYLAGRALIRSVDSVSRIVERRDDDRWRVPIALALGHSVSEGVLASPYQVLRRLIDMGDRSPAGRMRDHLLAAELALDLGWDRLTCGGSAFVEMRTELAALLAAVVEGGELGLAERLRAGHILGRMGDARDGVCGPAPAMRRIPRGRFAPGGRAGTPWREEWGARPQLVEAFELSRYPVTNAQYRLFVEAAGAGPAKHSGRVPRYWDDALLGSASPNRPVVGVSWHQAAAYCRWLTAHLRDGHTYALPTDLQWEYAARGDERRPYPWGVEPPDHERANYGEQLGSTTPVGCYGSGVTPEGILDLAGNVWEWTRSPYSPHGAGRERGGGRRPEPPLVTLRGGSWSSGGATLAATRRLTLSPSAAAANIGFRLARRPRR